jgi:hypothetical protein
MAKEQFLHIRFSQKDKKRVEAAAKANHLDTSTWARQVIMRAVERVEREEGQD